MNISDLKGKRVTVMGLGLHGGGVGVVKFLAEVGAQVLVTDLKSKEQLATSLDKLKELKKISYVFNQHRPEDFLKTDLVIKNPSVPWSNKYIKLALEKKIPVEMDSSLFFRLCKNQIIGVTGTKGKTTTASLLMSIFKAAGRDVLKVGVSQTSVLDKLKEVKEKTMVIFELSSWRLSALGRMKISPAVAILTNIYPDHLNYYRSMGEYVADKEQIFLHQKKTDLCVINLDDPWLEKSREKIKAEIVGFSRQEYFSGPGAYLRGEEIFFRGKTTEKKILNLRDIRLRGQHNQANVLAAVATTCALGVEAEKIQSGVRNFSGVSHRLELVREVSGVAFYNDSAATTPESAISGINSFAVPLVLICGGSNKRLDVSALAREIVKKAKQVILLPGQSTDALWERFRQETGYCSENFHSVGSMKEAVSLAAEVSQAGDVVLLSPGAASFGLFQNEFDRGDQFRECVKNLK